jgi:hypothetical protein
MMQASRIRAAAVVAGIAAVALAGCTVMHAPARVTGHRAENSARSVSVPVQTPQGQDQRIPARPASEVIPSAVRVVTLTMTTENFDSTANAFRSVKEPKPVTVTDPVKARRIAALLDGLPLAPTGAYLCPSGDIRSELTLTFKARTDAPALAIVTAELTDCAFIDVTVGGRQQPQLGPGDGGQTLAGQALEIAGLDWKIPG